MNTKRITEEEISDILISSLPTRPTAPGSFGGRGYTAKDMKSAFDRLPLYIISRFNSLLSDVARTGEGSLVYEIPTGISDAKTLGELLESITDGGFASLLSLGAETLAERMERLAVREVNVDGTLAVLLMHLHDKVYDGGSPGGRRADTGEVTV